MSYILDALQKSENERQSHVAPETYRLSRPLEAEHPSTVRWLLLLCLLTLFAVGLSILWQIWGAQSNAAAPQTISATPAEIPAQTKAPLKDTNRAAPTRSAQPRLSEASGSAKIAPKVSAPEATESDPSPDKIAVPEPSDAPRSLAKSDVAEQAVTPQPLVSPRQTESLRSVSKPAPAAKTATQQSPQQEKPSQNSVVKNTKPARVYSLAELPADIRASMPALAFSFHVYGSDPSRRTIIINGRRLREGQALNDAMRLRRITPDGVVMAYRNYDIALPVINQW